MKIIFSPGFQVWLAVGWFSIRMCPMFDGRFLGPVAGMVGAALPKVRKVARARVPVLI